MSLRKVTAIGSTPDTVTTTTEPSKMRNLLIGIGVAIAVAISAAALAIAITTYARENDASIRIATLDSELEAFNASLAVSDATIATLSYEVAMNAMHSVTSNTTIVSAGTLRWFSRCQSPFINPLTTNPLAWEDYAGKPESNYTVSRVTTSDGIIALVFTMEPPTEPIVQNHNPGWACSTFAVSNQEYFVSGKSRPESEYSAMMVQPEGSVYLDPPCNGTLCIVKDLVYVYISDPPEDVMPLFHFTQWFATNVPSPGISAETPFVARDLYITQTLQLAFVQYGY
jgi:hypothetical protein